MGRCWIAFRHIEPRHIVLALALLYALILSCAVVTVPQFNSSTCCIPANCNVSRLREVPVSPHRAWINRGVDPPYHVIVEGGEKDPKLCQFTPVQFEAMGCLDISDVPTNSRHETCHWPTSAVFFWMTCVGSFELGGLFIFVFVLLCATACCYISVTTPDERSFLVGAMVSCALLLIASGLMTAALIKEPFETVPAPPHDDHGNQAPMAGGMPLKVLMQVIDADAVFALMCLNCASLLAVLLGALVRLLFLLQPRACVVLQFKAQEAKAKWPGTFWFLHLNHDWATVDPQVASERQDTLLVRDKMMKVRIKMYWLKRRLGVMKLRHDKEDPTWEALIEKQQRSEEQPWVPSRNPVHALPLAVREPEAASRSTYEAPVPVIQTDANALRASLLLSSGQRSVEAGFCLPVAEAAFQPPQRRRHTLEFSFPTTAPLRHERAFTTTSSYTNGPPIRVSESHAQSVEARLHLQQ